MQASEEGAAGEEVMIRSLALIRRPAVALMLALTVACGGGGKTPSAPVPTPSATSSPNPAPTPVGTCPLGLGSGRFTCQGDTPGLLPRVNEAIDKLVKDQPALFNTENPPSAGGYYIYDIDSFYNGVIDNLVADGLCAQRDYVDRDKLSVKEDNSYNEIYDIVTTQNRIRRGPVTYMVTCTPANFPLTAEQAVATVSVSFFRYTECSNLTPPHNSIAVGCRGTITATPRDAQGNKLPVDLHSADVSWFVRNGDETTIVTSPAPDGVPFNLVIVARQVGEFSVCATVGSKTGCLNGFVIP
jgi:hypothetical protein